MGAKLVSFCNIVLLPAVPFICPAFHPRRELVGEKIEVSRR